MKNNVKLFFNCGECCKELPAGQSMEEFSRLNVGWTEEGVQVWCVRHNRNVVALDFLGQKIGYAKDYHEETEH